MTLFTLIGILFMLFLFYKIIMEVRDNYENQQEDEYILLLIEDIRKIHPKVDEVVDELKFFKGEKSYTLDKKYVYICKNDKKTGELYHRNQLVLVLIHEISHALCDEVGHTEKFEMIFDELLDNASKMGVYNPDIPSVQNYCE
jgi:hypothetical protein